MGSLNAFYVHAAEPARIKALCTAYPAAYTEAGSPFYAIERSADRFRCPEAELRLLSAQLKTDVIWLSYQSGVDAFQYRHWDCGDDLRSLVYGCENEREWEHLDGQPQDWEKEVLFGDLPSVLECCDTDDERREIERVYQGRIIEVGAMEPSLDGRETARGIAEHYHFPGWNLMDQ